MERPVALAGGGSSRCRHWPFGCGPRDPDPVFHRWSPMKHPHPTAPATLAPPGDGLPPLTVPLLLVTRRPRDRLPRTVPGLSWPRSRSTSPAPPEPSPPGSTPRRPPPRSAPSSSPCPHGSPGPPANPPPPTPALAVGERVAGAAHRRLRATSRGNLTTQPQRRNEGQEVEEPVRPAHRRAPSKTHPAQTRSNATRKPTGASRLIGGRPSGGRSLPRSAGRGCRTAGPRPDARGARP